MTERLTGKGQPQFLIADTFGDSLGRLTGDKQKTVKTTAFDLQMNPASPGEGLAARLQRDRAIVMDAAEH